MKMFKISVFTLSCRLLFLHLFMCLIYWPTSVSQRSSQPKQDVVMQIIVPLESLEPKLQPIHVYEKTSINVGFDPAYRNLREKFVIDSWLNSTQSETPAEILTLYCSEVFVRHVNAILSFNYGSGSVAANDYIMQLADNLGYPVISWDPQYPGALQVRMYVGDHILCKINVPNDFVCIRPTISAFHCRCIAPITREGISVEKIKNDQSQRLY